MKNTTTTTLSLTLLLVLGACSESGSGDPCVAAADEFEDCFGRSTPLFETAQCDADLAENFLENGCSQDDTTEQGKADQPYAARDMHALVHVIDGTRVPAPHTRLAAFKYAYDHGRGTVGWGVAGCIAGIYMLWGDAGERRIGEIFGSEDARRLMARPDHDEEAHRELARLEHAYWSSEDDRASDIYTWTAINVSVSARVFLQKTMGHMDVFDWWSHSSREVQVYFDTDYP